MIECEGQIDNKDLELLNKRLVESENIPKETIILATTNRKVDDINNTNLYRLKTPTHNYNAIIKGTWEDKEHPVKKEIILKDINLLSDKKIFDNEIFVNVRSTGKLLKSKLNLKNGKAKLNLLEDEYGISPGQACVFYSRDKNGDKVLGGGWIAKN